MQVNLKCDLTFLVYEDQGAASLMALQLLKLVYAENPAIQLMA